MSIYFVDYYTFILLIGYSLEIKHVSIMIKSAFNVFSFCFFKSAQKYICGSTHTINISLLSFSDVIIRYQIKIQTEKSFIKGNDNPLLNGCHISMLFTVASKNLLRNFVGLLPGLYPTFETIIHVLWQMALVCLIFLFFLLSLCWEKNYITQTHDTL